VVANVLEISPQRLWSSLERSAEIGRFREVGLRRLALSAEDKQMRDTSSPAPTVRPSFQAEIEAGTLADILDSE